MGKKLKLTEEQITEIRELRMQGYKNGYIAKKYNITPCRVTQVTKGF